VGIWNLRAEKLNDWYRGQEVYVKVADPLGYNRTEMAMPDNALYCGLLKDRQKYVSAEWSFSFDNPLDLELTSCSENFPGHRFNSQTGNRRPNMQLPGAPGSSQQRC
jgi:hypothetical protein